MFSAAMVAESAAALVGAALAAALTEAFGVVNVLTAQGGAYVLAGLAFAALMRRLGVLPGGAGPDGAGTGAGAAMPVDQEQVPVR